MASVYEKPASGISTTKTPEVNGATRRRPARMGDVDIELNSPELVRHMLKKDPVWNPDVLVGGQKVIFKNTVPKGTKGTGFEAQFPQFAPSAPAGANFCSATSMLS